jgi:hypothetical protein
VQRRARTVHGATRIALSNDEPLTPIEKANLLTQQPPDSFELNALAS